MATFTRGPWEVVSKAGYPAVFGAGRVICSPGGFSIGELRKSPAKAAQLVADAHLIAASPEMHDVLEFFVDSATDGRPVPEWMVLHLDAMRSALAKSEGK